MPVDDVAVVSTAWRIWIFEYFT